MNKKAILNLADHIDEAGDSKFDLNYWGYRPGTDEKEHDDLLNERTVGDVGEIVDVEHTCGTVGCVAGFQNSLANQKILKALGVKLKDFYNPITKKVVLPNNVLDQIRPLALLTAAADDLGLTYCQGVELFTPVKSSTADTVWQRSMGANVNAYTAKASQAATVLRDIAFGRVTFACDDNS